MNGFCKSKPSVVLLKKHPLTPSRVLQLFSILDQRNYIRCISRYSDQCISRYSHQVTKILTFDISIFFDLHDVFSTHPILSLAYSFPRHHSSIVRQRIKWICLASDIWSRLLCSSYDWTLQRVSQTNSHILLIRSLSNNVWQNETNHFTLKLFK